MRREYFCYTWKLESLDDERTLRNYVSYFLSKAAATREICHLPKTFSFGSINGERKRFTLYVENWSLCIAMKLWRRLILYSTSKTRNLFYWSVVSRTLPRLAYQKYPSKWNVFLTFSLFSMQQLISTVRHCLSGHCNYQSVFVSTDWQFWSTLIFHTFIV